MSRMAYTQEDLDSVNQAILDLATGKRSTRVTVDGITREFQAINLDELKGLKAEIIAGLDSTNNRPLYVRTSTYKGI